MPKIRVNDKRASSKGALADLRNTAGGNKLAAKPVDIRNDVVPSQARFRHLSSGALRYQTFDPVHRPWKTKNRWPVACLRSSRNQIVLTVCRNEASKTIVTIASPLCDCAAHLFLFIVPLPSRRCAERKMDALIEAMMRFL